jgi:hypothetical protein
MLKDDLPESTTSNEGYRPQVEIEIPKGALRGKYTITTHAQDRYAEYVGDSPDIAEQMAERLKKAVFPPVPVINKIRKWQRGYFRKQPLLSLVHGDVAFILKGEAAGCYAVATCYRDPAFMFHTKEGGK